MNSIRIEYSVPNFENFLIGCGEEKAEAIARDVEDYFVNQLKTAGDTGGGDKPLYVYAYRKSSNTNP